MTDLHDESRRIALADEAATARLAARLAALARPGAALALSGGLGAGKTAITLTAMRDMITAGH
ncbi:MAG: tRNA (adenosine(37)-N6)-threonylcarbamoyltransferase complex ATPase subunit type 1 TsaE, partial [Alphaproteobacteria bacterium]